MEQRALVSSLTERIGTISGMKAVVLGGSHARGRAKPESDIDLGLFIRKHLHSRFSTSANWPKRSTTPPSR
ncbi:MAG: nucleotidyltransferase domain-containing protein [Blastocatellia bacterium]